MRCVDATTHLGHKTVPPIFNENTPDARRRHRRESNHVTILRAIFPHKRVRERERERESCSMMLGTKCTFVCTLMSSYVRPQNHDIISEESQVTQTNSDRRNDSFSCYVMLIKRLPVRPPMRGLVFQPHSARIMETPCVMCTGILRIFLYKIYKYAEFPFD